MSIGRTNFTWVDDPRSLASLATALAEAEEITFDTESNSGFRYEEKLCLLQLNVAGQLWMVDPLAFDRGDWIDSLRSPLEDPQVRIWIHGGEFDVSSMKRDFGIRLRGLWDTQQAATFLGHEKTGYGSLVETICGVSLPKAFTRYDWGTRPLPSGPRDYALDDVRYLPKVAHALMREVEVHDLSEEVGIAGRAVEDAEWPDLSPTNALWRVKGVGKLPVIGQRRVLMLLKWREEIARQRDQPPGRILSGYALLSLAENPPRKSSVLRYARVPRPVRDRYGDQLVGLLKRTEELPQIPQRTITPRQTPQEKARSKSIRNWKRSESKRRGIPQQAVLPTRAAEFLVYNGADDLTQVPQLGAKRIRLYGSKLRQLCASPSTSTSPSTSPESE